MKSGRWRNWRPFVIILGSTIVLWLGMAMSEVKDYPVTYRLVWAGVDRTRYAVTYADTTLRAMQRTNGFVALGRSIRHRQDNAVTLDLSATMAQQHGTRFTVGYNARSVLNAYINQNGLTGIRAITPDKDSLYASFAERNKKAYAPVLKGVEYTFMQHYGVYGNATVSPDTVWLYGAPEALERIEQVCTTPTIVANISKSGHHSIDLDTSRWHRYGDVRASTTTVDIFIPVEHFVERTFLLPVQLKGMPDSTMRVRMYPEKAKVTLTVPEKKYNSIDMHSLQAVAYYDAAAENGQLAVEMRAFPDFARIKNIEPKYVHAVVFK